MSDSGFGGRRTRHQEDCEALTRSVDPSKSILPYNYSILYVYIYVYIYTYCFFVFALFDIYHGNPQPSF